MQPMTNKLYASYLPRPFYLSSEAKARALQVIVSFPAVLASSVPMPICNVGKGPKNSHQIIHFLWIRWRAGSECG